MTDSKKCPVEGCCGKLKTRTSRKRGVATIERRRVCTCCEYSDVATVRPAEIISIRVVHTKVEPIELEENQVGSKT